MAQTVPEYMWNVGDKVTWLKTQRGGYGFVTAVPCVVTKLGAKRVQVEAPLLKGGTTLRWVDPLNLRARGGDEEG